MPPAACCALSPFPRAASALIPSRCPSPAPAAGVRPRFLQVHFDFLTGRVWLPTFERTPPPRCGAPPSPDSESDGCPSRCVSEPSALRCTPPSPSRRLLWLVRLNEFARHSRSQARAPRPAGPALGQHCGGRPSGRRCQLPTSNVMRPWR